MAARLSYEDSCRRLQELQLLGAGNIPGMRARPPRFDEVEPGVRFFRTLLANVKLEHLTLPYTFFSRSEIRQVSFRGSDFSGSVANWNDFIEVKFTGTDLSGSDFRACLFEQVSFRRATLIGVDFRYGGFNQCDFTEADLADAKITRKAGAALKLSPEQQGVIDWQAEEGEEPPGG